MNSSTLTTKGRVTIPKRVRDYLGLSPGDKVRFNYEDNGAPGFKAERVAADWVERSETHTATWHHEAVYDPFERRG